MKKETWALCMFILILTHQSALGLEGAGEPSAHICHPFIVKSPKESNYLSSLLGVVMASCTISDSGASILD